MTNAGFALGVEEEDSWLLPNKATSLVSSVLLDFAVWWTTGKRVLPILFRLHAPNQMVEQESGARVQALLWKKHEHRVRCRHSRMKGFCYVLERAGKEFGVDKYVPSLANAMKEMMSPTAHLSSATRTIGRIGSKRDGNHVGFAELLSLDSATKGYPTPRSLVNFPPHAIDSPAWTDGE
ncbi:hypothetical protein ARMGADRAFT_1039461 [Armillaria gallica]|uniref:Uncharacterized protein n=1 Tax=Armillaria gallica TaxID=47427 RepID=A0A2H3CHH5_ARMGA|nr:hypothetical protein ARMGADRAFT_1039461 [Armillaria gallica]